MSVKVIRVMVGEPRMAPSLCGDCHHTTLIELPVWLMSSDGVTSIDPLSRCAYCSEADDVG